MPNLQVCARSHASWAGFACQSVSGSCINGLVNDLYTKNDRPLQRSGDKLYSRSGQYLGRIRNDKVYDPSGTSPGTGGPFGAALVTWSWRSYGG